MKSNVRNKMIMVIAAFTTLAVGAIAQASDVDAAEIYCTIRDTGNHLNCQWVGKDQRRSMTPEETAQFIDKSEVASYISVRSRKGLERVFGVDPESTPFRKLSEVKKTGSITEIAKAKLELFSEIEKRVVKISDDLDAASVTMELVKYDDSVAVDKYKRELRRMDNELIALKGSTGAGANSSYESGPKSIDQDATGDSGDYYDAKYTYGMGLGFASNTVTVSSNGTSPSYPTVYADFRANWDWKWLTYTELEGRFGFRTATTSTGSAANTAANPTSSNITVKDAKCWGVWCAELDIASYNYVALAPKVTTQFDTYTDTLFGASAVYRQKIHNGVVYYRLGYLVGSATNNMGGSKPPSSENMIIATAQYERNISRNDGIGAEFGVEQITAALASSVGSGSVVNTNVLANAYYKHSF